MSLKKMNLKEKLEDLLNHLSNNQDAISINHYFGANFWDEYPDEDEDILDFLTEKFYDIEMIWIEDKEIESPVRKTLQFALHMLEKKEQGKQLISLKMNLDDYKMVEKLLPDLYPDIAFFLKNADHNLVKLGLCKSAPCVVQFLLDQDEFEEVILDLIDIETDAFNTPNGAPPKDDNPFYQKYLKYSPLYTILSNAEKLKAE